MLTEHWSGATGRSGMKDDGMAMEGYIHYVGNGTRALFSRLWMPLPDGSTVRQNSEQSHDDGKSWVPWFDGFHSHKD